MKIDKNVPIPEKKSGRPTKETFETISKLEIDDSFLVDNPKNLPMLQLRNQTNSKMVYYGKKLDYKFTIRETIEGLRVWRIK